MPPERLALRLRVGGVVQGVGFRPFVYRLARRLALGGRVYNDAAGVVIEVNGPVAAMDEFCRALVDEAPPAAVVRIAAREELAVAAAPSGPEADSAADFHIEPSAAGGPPRAGIAPDLASCPDCLRELSDPADRRYRYPFINCTNCGPRYTIIEKIPYDRPHTSMRDFALCPACRAEYADPADRRFHAQPNACPACGPGLYLEVTVQQHRRFGRSARLKYTGYESPGCLPESAALLNGYAPLKRQVMTPGERLHLAPTAGAEPQCCSDRAATDAILEQARKMLLAGRIVAVKGIGGFHLAVNAADEQAVVRLRRRKGRAAKPLALMVRDSATARRLVELTAEAEAQLTSPARPIVLVPKRDGHGLAAAVAPGASRLGIMLPYTPLHHLLLSPELPVLVLTSANPSSQPMVIADQEAHRRLAGIADAILGHNRPIVRANDDSVVLVGERPPTAFPVTDHGGHGVSGHGGEAALTAAAGSPAMPRDRLLFLRRGRGFAPAILPLAANRGPALLGVGAELKNTVCLAAAGRAVISQHLGDLQNLETYELFRRTIADLAALFAIEPQKVVCDLHPDYLSSRWARQWAQEQGAELVPVQHHHAHLAACLAEHGYAGEAVGLILDGTGYGPDGTIWGGEILVGSLAASRRRGHLETMPLPGGDAAVREPWRTGLAYLYEAFEGQLPAEVERLFEVRPELAGPQALPWSYCSGASGAFNADSDQGAPVGETDLADRGGSCDRRQSDQRELLLTMLAKKINCPLTSSCGRLFDAVAAICGLRSRISYEAQAAIELMELGGGLASPAYRYGIQEGEEGIVLAIRPLLRDIARAVLAGEEPALISRRFHCTLVELFALGVERVAAEAGLKTVVLSGGVMQNEILLFGLQRRLGAAGLTVLFPRLLPPNDGGIAYGQVACATA